MAKWREYSVKRINTLSGLFAAGTYAPGASTAGIPCLGVAYGIANVLGGTKLYVGDTVLSTVGNTVPIVSSRWKHRQRQRD